MAALSVALVAAHETIWEGEASMVIARTLGGELAIMPGHTPLLGILAPGEVRVTPLEGSTISAEVDHGFLSVEQNRVLVVAETAEVGEPDRR